MVSRRTRKELKRAKASAADAFNEAVAAGALGAQAIRGGATVLGRQAQADLGRAANSVKRQHPFGLFEDRPRTSLPRRGKPVKVVVKRKPEKAPPKLKRLKAAVKTGKPLGNAAPLTATGFWLLAALIVAWPQLREPEGSPKRRYTQGLSGLLEQLRDELSPVSEPARLDAAEPGRGRAATSPREIPARGWRDILKRTWSEFNDDRITAVAGGVTFFSLLALFPAMAAFVSLYGLFFDSSKVSEHLRVLAGVMPAEALKFFGEQMLRMAQAHGSTLSLTFISTLLVSLWSANAGVKALFDGLNVAYEQKERRSFIKLNLVSLAFTVGGIAFLALAAASVIVVPIVLGLIGFKLGSLGPILEFARWPLLLLGAAAGLSALYRYGPSRAHPQWRWITPGSLAAALLWLAVSMLFSFYVAHFGSYNKTYGSLGAVVGFMTWIWLSIIVVLFGAELNSEIEHQTAVDSTTGPPRPMGARGAKVADEVAPA